MRRYIRVLTKMPLRRRTHGVNAVRRHKVAFGAIAPAEHFQINNLSALSFLEC